MSTGPQVAATYSDHLQKFLSFAILAAGGFIGEVQLAITGHDLGGSLAVRWYPLASGWPLTRWILVLAVVLAGLITAWGLLAAADEYVWICEVEKETFHSVRVPWIARGNTLTHWMKRGIIRGHGVTGLDFVGGIGLVLVVLVGSLAFL